MNTNPIKSTVLLAAAAVALAACSTSGVGALGRSSSPSSPPVSAPAPASQPESSDDPSSPPSDQPSDQAASDAPSVDRLLLTSGEVGGDFTKVTGDQEDTPLPCTPNAPGPLTQVPSTAHAQADFVTADQNITITERVITYADAGSAELVLDAVHRGFGCETATVGGATLQIAGPNDVRSVVVANVDQADDWTLRSEAGEAELIVVRAGTTVVQVVFTATPGSSIQIDPTQVLRTAVAKAINGG